MTMTASNQALALPSNELLKTDMKAIKDFQMIVQQNMVEGHDYGVIPGTKKPTLLKPGAEKITKILGLADTYDFIDRQEDWDKPFFRYLVQCTLTSINSGKIITQGMGECNSYESKYRYRWLYDNELPQGIDKTSLVKQVKQSHSGGTYTRYRMDNEDIFSQVNTLVKMACKRALVAVALSAGRLSEIFTQDMEDIVDVDPIAAKPAERKTMQPAKKPKGEATKSESSPANEAGNTNPPDDQSDTIHAEQIVKLETLAKEKGANIGELVKAKGWPATKPSELSIDQVQVLIDDLAG